MQLAAKLCDKICIPIHCSYLNLFINDEILRTTIVLATTIAAVLSVAVSADPATTTEATKA